MESHSSVLTIFLTTSSSVDIFIPQAFTTPGLEFLFTLMCVDLVYTKLFLQWNLQRIVCDCVENCDQSIPYYYNWDGKAGSEMLNCLH